jgi:uncharacterized protein with FMN-binding domain
MQVKYRCVIEILLVVGCLTFNANAENEQNQLKTKEQVDTIIQQTGSISPDWWDSVELSFPQTLDMNWPVQQGFTQMGGRGGRGSRMAPGSSRSDFSRSVDQYINNVIYANPSRYKEGIRLVHRLMIMHKDSPQKLQRSLNMLGQMFYDLMGDYTRAAFWWQKCAQFGGSIDSLKMAYCYYELGSKTTAMEMVSQAGSSYSRNNRDTIKLWAKIGEVDKALGMISSNTSSGGRGGSQGDNNLLSAEICRLAGRYDQAIEYYQKAASSSNSWGGRGGGGRDTNTRANANMEATKLLGTLDITQIPDGTYSGSSIAYGGTLYLNVKVSKGRIESVTVTQHRETSSFFTRAQPTIRKIVVQQGFDVDTVTGATITSDAIINAAVKALAGAVQ